MNPMAMTVINSCKEICQSEDLNQGSPGLKSYMPPTATGCISTQHHHRDNYSWWERNESYGNDCHQSLSKVAISIFHISPN